MSQTPHKTEYEKRLTAKYLEWIAFDGIIPDYIIAQFKRDRREVRKTNPLYQNL